ncbi:MAG: rane protein [Rhodospirillales bacterium]|nr:rane protein [Rhodospirillales bacterium]
MTAASETSTALHGAWRLARLDPRGMAFFDRSAAGFWHSYRAAVILYPVFLILLLLPSAGGEAPAPDADWFRIILVETIGYVIGWTGFPLLMLPLTRFLDCEARWLDYIVAYNWSQVLQGSVLLASSLLIASNLLPDPLAGGIAVAASVAVLLYGWFIARVALGISPTAAIVVVLVDQVFAIFISRIVQALH